MSAVRFVPLRHSTILTQDEKMVMMMERQPQHHPSNGACVIVSAGVGNYLNTTSGSPPHFTNLDSHMTESAPTSAVTTASTLNRSIITCSSNNNNNNNNSKVKNNNNNNMKVSKSQGGAVQKARAIAPAARNTVLVNNTSSSAASESLRCKRRIQFSGNAGSAATPQQISFTGHQPASVARRNARERNRVKQVNAGFATLRSHIPPSVAAALQESSAASSSSSERSSRGKDKDAAKKLSKVETLRMAVEYIRSLQLLLSESGASENSAPVQVKTESMDTGSPNGFDPDYEAAIALSQYSSASNNQDGLQGGHHHHQLLPGLTSMSPPCSDASSSSSPTPSYVSDGSVGASSTGYAPMFVGRVSGPPGHLVQCRPSTPNDAGVYEPMSPEDEELLDVISWWQQSS